MEDQSNLIIQTLPPILSSIGGFFVLLFFGFGKEDKERRLMSAALLVLLIWIAYVCVIMAGEKLTLFSPYITIICLISAIIIFSTVFYLNIRKNKINDMILIALFSLGILLSTIGFVNYFGMEGRVVIAVVSPECEEDIALKKEVGGTSYSIREIRFLDEVGFVVATEDVSIIQSISIECPGKNPNENPLEAFSKSSRGIGGEYVYRENQ